MYDKLKDHLVQLDLHDNGSGSYMIVYENRYFSIGRFLYEILYEIKENVHNSPNFKENYEISDEQYEELLDLATLKTGEILNSKGKKKRFLFFSVNLLPGKYVEKLASHFRFLFRRSVFITLLLLGLLANFLILFDFKFNLLGISSVHIKLPLVDVAMIYVFLAVIMFFHELGHATGSLFFNQKPKEIGFGIYMFFPVLFSNVSGIWKLNKKHRILVNLGGVYFQCIASIIMCSAVMMLGPFKALSHMLVLVAKTNMLVMAYSMLPFIRNDGYWILSDYLNLPGLNKVSYSYIADVFRKREKINFLLLGYCIGQYLFVAFLVLKIVDTFPSTIGAMSMDFTKYGIQGFIYHDFFIFVKFLFQIIIGCALASTFYNFLKPMITSTRST